MSRLNKPLSDYLGSRQQGIIKKVIEDRGFGFLACNELPTEVFFHFRSLNFDPDDLRVEAKVSFLFTEGLSGKYEAASINLISVSRERKIRKISLQQDEKDNDQYMMKNHIVLFGTVTSSNNKYGFVHVSHEHVQRIPWSHYNGGKIFFHQRSNDPFKVYDQISFSIQEDKIMGTIAYDIHAVKVKYFNKYDNPWYPDSPYDKFASNKKLYKQEFFYQQTEIPIDENRYNEFKALTNTSTPDKSFAAYSGKYMSGFLNADGGTLYGGIEDDGTIVGVYLSRAQKDNCRLLVDREMRAMKPQVDPSFFHLKFIPIVHSFDYEENSVVEIPNKYVIAMTIKKGSSDIAYKLKDNSAYVRAGGSTQRMDDDMIMARTKNVYEAKLRKQSEVYDKKLADMNRKFDLLQKQISQQQIIAPSVHDNNHNNQVNNNQANNNNHNDISADREIIDQVCSMGFEKGNVLEEYFNLKTETPGIVITVRLLLDKLT